MEVLVNRLLFLSRSAPGVTSGSFEPLGLHDLLETCMTGKAFADIDLHMDEELGVRSDPELLKILFQNLLQNAIAHRSPGSRVSCRLKKASSGVYVQIENEVDGFSEADLDRISEPFWQKDASGTSTGHYGLGVSIVRNLERVLGLEITFSIRGKENFLVEVLFPGPQGSAEA